MGGSMGSVVGEKIFRGIELARDRFLATLERAGVVEVRAGLSTGETVVTAGKGSLSDGARVEIIEIGAQPKA